MFLAQRTSQSTPKGMSAVLLHVLWGLALLYFLSHFPFPTIDFVYENY